MKKLKSIKEFEQLKESIKRSRDPSKPCITVCCGTGCIASGGRDVFTRFQEEIKAKKIDAKVNSKNIIMNNILFFFIYCQIKL